jgi:hypothetical protein
MELVRSFVVDGKVVEKTGMKLKGLDIYQYEDKYSTVTLYFVNSRSEVEYTMKIEADCGQNVGYVASIECSKV